MDHSMTSTLRQPSRATRSRARATIAGDASIPTMRPCGPILSRSMGKHSPVPQPTSRTTSPGFGASPATIARRNRWKARVRWSYRRASFV
jgi:hypothetical protein